MVTGIVKIDAIDIGTVGSAAERVIVEVIICY